MWGVRWGVMWGVMWGAIPAVATASASTMQLPSTIPKTTLANSSTASLACCHILHIDEGSHCCWQG